MKLVTDDEVILGSGNQASKKFSIATSAKAFKILSSNLYKNKIRAIIRELSCNCIDAHFLNGQTKPFTIKAPSQLDPRFVIRDFGPGLSEDDVLNLYTTYFASTKSNSNDFIGALGLGSKSPFSYTETFTVVSYHDGMIRGFNAMLDGGEPVLKPTFVEQMKEGDETGIEITVPVKMNDLSSWLKEIRYVLRPFAGKVELTGTKTEIDFFPEFEDTYSIPYNYNGFENEGIYALYGNIVYPLNECPGLTKSWLQIKNDITFVRFALGELDITPSREELSFDEQTAANVRKRIEELGKKVLEEDLKDFANETNDRKIHRMVDNLSYDARNFLQNRSVVFGVKKYNWRQLQVMHEIPKYFAEVGCAYEMCTSPTRKRIKWSSNSKTASVNRLYGHNTEKLVVLLNDVKNNKKLDTIRGLAQLTREDKLPAGYPKLKTFDDIVMFDVNSELEMKTLALIKTFFGEDPVEVYKMSELTEAQGIVKKEEVNKGPSAVRPKSPNGYRLVKNPSGGLDHTDLFLSAKDVYDLDEEWVLFKNRDDFYDIDGKIIHNITEYSIKTCVEYIDDIKEYIVLRPSVWKYAYKNNKLKSLYKRMSEFFIELIDTVDYDEYTVDSGSYSYYSRHINKHKCLAPMDKFFTERGSVSAAAMKLKNYAMSFKNSWTENVDEHKLARNIFESLAEFATDKQEARVKKFEKENVVLSEYMKGRYSMSETQAADFAKLLNLGS
ncbi:protector from phage-induced early lysis [Serratia phage X20]|uniref:Protector from phage-induced early lysis n=1 Tax=Serratia phage X20 TaxID=2006942 RepID=A0A1Z1LYQ9_9CAUD|nr:RIIA lysis inhibitor [Serratia phage X20]ARW57974.1 protector from phage-induced early lysis [Serratia phage X20]